MKDDIRSKINESESHMDHTILKLSRHHELNSLYV